MRETKRKDEVLNFIIKKGAVTTKQIANGIGCLTESIDYHLRILRSEKKIYVSGFDLVGTCSKIRIYSAGNEKDAVFENYRDRLIRSREEIRANKRNLKIKSISKKNWREDPITAAIFLG